MSSSKHDFRRYRWALVGAAALFLLPAIQLSLFLLRATSHRPEFRMVEGQLAQYVVGSNSKSKMTTLFSLAGHPGRFWTQAAHHPKLVGSWQLHRTQLRFYVEENPRYSPMQGDAVKTFGLWVDGRVVQSLDAKLEEEAWQHKLILLIDIFMYGAAAWVLTRAYRLFASPHL